MPATQKQKQIQGPHWTVVRVLAGLAALLLFPAPVAQVTNMIREGANPALVSLDAVMLAVCWLGGWFALYGQRRSSRVRMKRALAGGVFGVIIGFVVGFFGPLFFLKANTGPLAGFFVTGPLGFVLGVLFGAIYALVRAPRHGKGPADPPCTGRAVN